MNQLMNPKTTNILVDILQSSHQNLLSLSKLLSEEKSLLEKHDRSQLPRINEAKNTLIDALEKNEGKLLSTMPKSIADSFRIKNKDKLTHKPLIGKNNLDALLKHVTEAQAKPLAMAWKQVSQALNDCKRQNEVNGKIVSQSQASVNALLKLIKGDDHAHGAYQPNGMTKNANASRWVVKA